MTYTQAQIDKANAVDLEKFLRAQGETLVRSGKEYRWKAHDSLTVCGNKWFRHSQSKGGFPVDFVMEFYGKSFPEAVQMLTGEPGEAQPEADPAPSPAFRLPLRNVTNANILNYLTQERKLSPSLVNFFIAAGDIYEDAAHHNVVFVGRDADGHPRYASSRGIREKFRQDAAGAEKAFGFAHRGTDKQLLVFEAPIDLLSFIELFPKNWQQHNYLSLGGVSGKALRQFLSERPDVERVFLCLDADKAGEDACKRLTALLPDTVSVTRIQPCMKDWNEVLVHRAEIPNRNYFKSIVLKESPKKDSVKIIRMSDVELTPVEWLWKPYLPFGKLSVLQGNPGEGKTYFAMHLAAACTNGKLLPNMERLEPFNVIYQTAEDGLGDTVKPRLIEAGADLDRVLVIDDSDVQLTLSDERIEKAIIENNAKLVIIDPIQAYLGADVDMNRANEVRPIFMRLGQVAQRTGCAILLIDTYKADTIEELAGLLGIPADELQKTIDRYNELCDKGSDVDFGKKSTYMHKIEKAPFWGIRKHIRVSSIDSGVNTNANGQALDADGNVIDGLYCVGNVGGVFYGGADYPFHQTGLSLGRCYTFGMLAAKHAMGQL